MAGMSISNINSLCKEIEWVNKPRLKPKEKLQSISIVRGRDSASRCSTSTDLTEAAVN